MENMSRETKVNEEFDKCCICGGTLQNGYANLFVDSSGYAARIDERCHNVINAVVHGEDANTIQSSLKYLSQQREYVHPAIRKYIDSYVQHGEQRLLALRNASIVPPVDRHQHYLRSNVQDTENSRSRSNVSRVSDSSETATIVAARRRMPEHYPHEDSRTRNESNAFMNDLPSIAARNASSTASANESENVLNQPHFLRSSGQDTENSRRRSNVSRVSDSSETATIVAARRRMPEYSPHEDSRTRNESNAFMNNLPSIAARDASGTASADESENVLSQPQFLRQNTARAAPRHRATTSRREVSNDYTNDEQKSSFQQNFMSISAIQERMDQYDPSTPVKSTRSLIALILLSVLTLLLYAIFFWIGYCRDINRICQGDGKHTFNIGIAYAIGWIIGLITVIVMLAANSLDVIFNLISIIRNPLFIILMLIGFIAICTWVVTTQNRIVSNGHRYHARITNAGGTVLAWQTVGILVLGFGPLIAQYIMLDSLNHLADAYNQENNLY